jgi:hypothetical protein
MPKLSKTSSETHNQMGTGQEWAAHLGDNTCGIVSLPDGGDLTPLLVGLPNDECQCPHWGYVISGTLVFPHDGTEESFAAGEAFYVGPGHTNRAEPGTEFVIFSPSDLLAVTEANIAARAQEMGAKS